MSFKHVINRGWSDGRSSLTGNVEQIADGEISLDVVVPANTNNLAVDLAFVVSRVKSLFITSDKAVTIKTNSSGAPTQTLTRAANQPLDWTAADADACPFTANVTTAFITNATSAAANVRIRILHDITP